MIKPWSQTKHYLHSRLNMASYDFYLDRKEVDNQIHVLEYYQIYEDRTFKIYTDIIEPYNERVQGWGSINGAIAFNNIENIIKKINPFPYSVTPHIDTLKFYSMDTCIHANQILQAYKSLEQINDPNTTNATIDLFALKFREQFESNILPLYQKYSDQKVVYEEIICKYPIMGEEITGPYGIYDFISGDGNDIKLRILLFLYLYKDQRLHDFIHWLNKIYSEKEEFYKKHKVKLGLLLKELNI